MKKNPSIDFILENCHTTAGVLLPLSREVLKRGAKFRFCARGGSMTPFIRDGDILTIAPLISSFCRLGDVVAFVHPKNHTLSVHRILSASKTRYLLQGDALYEADGWVPSADILGRVDSIERSGKNVRFGLGTERILIAWLCHHRFLWRLRQVARRLMKHRK